MNERRGGMGGAGAGSIPPGALEASVTLDEVFAVVTAKRVPLAPELAGYLSLEIAEGSQASGGEIDPRFVYIGDEGTVALVRPKRDGARGESNEAEGSVRAILAKLLDASGSQTQSLAAAARRTKPSGMALLVEELEAALIPVNRAAGRRALARLAREVKRVTLGVGRNASRPSSPSYSAVRDDPPSSRAPSRPFGEESSTAKRDVPADVLASPQVRPSPPPPREPTPAPPQVREPTPAPPQVREQVREQLREPVREPTPAPPAATLLPVQREPAPIELDQLPTMEITKEQNEALQPSIHTRDAVDHLLDSFGVSDRGEGVAARELKALVGLEPTPPPLQAQPAKPPAPSHDVVFSPEPPKVVVRDPISDSPGSDHGEDVESLLAMSEPGPPVIERSRVPMAPLESPPTSISPRLANEPIQATDQAPSAARASANRTENESARAMRESASEPMRATSPSASGASTSAPTGPSMRKLKAPSGGEFTPPRAPREGRFLTLAALFILAAGGAAIWTLRPSFFSGHTDRTDVAPIPSSNASATAPLARCKATLIVTDVPAHAEVLFRVGQAPADVDRMPVGARLEFVATAEGFAPKRTVVPAGAPWDPGADGKPRFEVAVQLDKSRARPGTVDNWPAGEPGSAVGGQGAPGTVHIVSTPRGAELWLLAGLGPEAKIDQLKCGTDIDILVAGPTTLRKRVHVASTDFKAPESGGDPSVTVSATTAPAGPTTPHGK